MEIADDVLLAIGRLVTDTAKLEWALLYLVAVAEGHDDTWIDSTLSSPGGQPLKQLRRFAATQDKYRPHLTDLANKAEGAILARHIVAHSVPAVDGSLDTSERTLRFWHPKTATFRDVDELSAANLKLQSGTTQTLSVIAFQLAGALVDSQRADEKTP